MLFRSSFEIALVSAARLLAAVVISRGGRCVVAVVFPVPLPFGLLLPERLVGLLVSKFWGSSVWLLRRSWMLGIVRLGEAALFCWDRVPFAGFSRITRASVGDFGSVEGCGVGGAAMLRAGRTGPCSGSEAWLLLGGGVEVCGAAWRWAYGCGLALGEGFWCWCD